MTENGWKIFAGLVIAGCLMVFIKWQYAAGFLLGCIVSVVTFRLTERFCDQALRMRSASGTMGHFMINFLIWGAALTLCAIAKDWLNILTCALGITTVKLAIIIDSLVNRT